MTLASQAGARGCRFRRRLAAGPLVMAAWLAAAAFFAPVRIELSPPSLVADVAGARPGGGSSFHGSSSGSSHSSSGSSSHSSSSHTSSSRSTSSSSSSHDSSSDDDTGIAIIAWLFSTLLGGAGFIAFVFLLIAMSVVSRLRQASSDWNAGVPDEDRRKRVRPELEGIRASDPNFSIVLLEDFLYALYAQAHTLR